MDFDPRPVAGMLIVLGMILVAVGVLLWTGALSWFGRLPGDIHIEGERTHVYIPLASMLLVSVLLSLIAWLLHRLG